SKKTVWELAKIVFAKIFKERTFITNKQGRFVYYRISPQLQSFAFAAIVAIGCWTTFTTRMYFKNYDTMREKDEQVAEAREKFNIAVADIRAYRDTIEDINKKMVDSHNYVVDMLHKNTSLSKLERDKLLKERLLITTELKYVNQSLDEFARDIRWANLDTSSGYKTTKNELEKNVVLNENIFLKKRNNQLESSINDMSELQNSLVDKIIVLADDKISTIEKTLSKIDIILSQVNLKDRNNLVRKVQEEKDEGLGGRYVPLKNIDLSDAELNQKFKNANLKVNLWEGLDKVKTMLPLGAPVRTNLRITSPFGVRSDPFLGTPAMHTGMDFGGHDGTPLYSTSKGKVIQAGNRGDYGLSVEVYHGLGFSTLYAHLSKISVKKGDLIEEGTKVGLAGSTGRSTGVHLHYELRYNGRPLNPYAFVKVEN
ncbi:MAG: peptidoglycan DD-metalloendopeptidase family protein, partial [Rickettsiales bacterium]|nr:peptidoglycan DD-metalloendopeptidase family protein [Rickettsiales bacterium]